MSTPSALQPGLATRLLEGAIEVQPLTPEAGARRYYRPIRAQDRGCLLVRSDDPPPRATATWLASRRVRVPRIVAERRGAYLVEDCGDRHLAHQPLLPAYESLLELGERIGRGVLPHGHPNSFLALDERLFVAELRIFREWHLQAWLRRAHSPRVAAEVDAACAQLAAEAAGGPWRVQHRDFHSRNVLLAAEGRIVIIDHQDLRPGPLFYDLASLATDAYADPPAEVCERLAAEVAALGARYGLGPEESALRFRAVALQRVLKALGTFGRLLARGRSDYAAAERRARGHALALLAEHGPAGPIPELLAW